MGLLLELDLAITNFCGGLEQDFVLLVLEPLGAKQCGSALGWSCWAALGERLLPLDAWQVWRRGAAVIKANDSAPLINSWVVFNIL